MRTKLFFIVCSIAWIASELLLIFRLNIGLIDALLLCTFGAGCVGTVLFARLILKEKKGKTSQ